MNSTNCSMNCSTAMMALDIAQLEWEYLHQHAMYSIVLLGIFCAIGTFGNFSVLWVYPDTYKKSTFTTFVVFLAGVDLFSSVLCIPLHMVDMRFRYTFMSAGFCKFIRYVTYSSSGASGMLLGVIAYERFRKICRPLKWQMSKTVVFRVCVGVIVIALVICSPTLDFYGVAETEVLGYPEVYGGTCGPVKSEYNTIFFGCLLLIGTVIVILATIFYILIIRAVCRQTKYMRDTSRNSEASIRATMTTEIRSSNLLDENKRKSKVPDNNVQQDKESDNNFTTDTTSDNEPSFNLENHSSRTTSTIKRQKRKKANSIERAIRSAFMFLVTSVFSYCGFLPMLITSLIRAINSDVYEDMEKSTGSLMELLTRTYFFNSIINPIVYCFMDEKFRESCKEKYKQLCCKCCK